MKSTKCKKVCNISPDGAYCVACNRSVQAIFEAGIWSPNEEDYTDIATVPLTDVIRNINDE